MSVTPQVVLGIEQFEQRRLLGVIGLRRIARRGANALVLLEDQIVGREVLIRRITPELAAHPRMHALGKGFGEAIGQRLAQDRGVIVIGILETVGHHVFADAGGDDEGADVIGDASDAGAMKSDKAELKRPSRFSSCWRRVCRVAIGLSRASSA